MNREQRDMFDKISKRWCVASFDGLTLQQAAFDIGYLQALIVELDDALAESLEGDSQ